MSSKNSRKNMRRKGSRSQKKRKQVKKGGFEYVNMLDQSYPLSPCYRPQGKPEIFKAGWHAGGSAKPCDYEPTVREMGVYDQPLTDKANPSQKAWFERFSCPKGSLKTGGKKKSKSKKSANKSVKKSRSKINDQEYKKIKSKIRTNKQRGGHEAPPHDADYYKGLLRQLGHHYHKLLEEHKTCLQNVEYYKGVLNKNVMNNH